VLKSPQFYSSLACHGEGVQVFAQALVLKPEALSLADGVRIDDFCRLEGGQGLEVGRHVHISSFCSILGGGRCLLGDLTAMAQGSRIVTGSEQLDAAMSASAPPELRHVKTSTVVMDHLSFLAANAVLLPGVSLGMGAVLAAGSVATKPVPAWEVWAGVPAKRIASRDPDALRARGVPVDELRARGLLVAV
jgi:acetyltransferase-like isoleucine patch superfamily enzyme